MSRAPSRVGETGTFGLWFAVLAGALAWSAHLLVSYALLPPACAARPLGPWLLHAVTLATLAVTLAGLWLAYRKWRACPPEEPGSTGGRTGYRRFMALAGLLMNGLFAFAILLEGLPVAIVSPCL